MATNDIPKLFISGDPGAVITGNLLELRRTWRNHEEVTVRGKHFLQKDSPHEIGKAIADEIASLIGKEIGIPDLKWVKFPAEDFKKVLLDYGFADGAANDYVEMFATLDTGLLFEDIQKTKPRIEGTSIEEFAKTWAAAYR
jgi:hypothetical protein